MNNFRRRILIDINGSDGTSIDMGNGVLWATSNLTKDANGTYKLADNPWDYGAYFSWGDIEGHNVAGQNEGYEFSYDNYNNGVSGSGYSLTASFSSGDATYDAARAKLGDLWRIPTKTEYEWLLSASNCTQKWVTNYEDSGVSGRLFTSKVNGNKLFFPTAGYYNYTSLSRSVTEGYYWSVEFGNSGSAYYFHPFNSSCDINTHDIYFGHSVRPVTLVPLPPITDGSQTEALDVLFARNDGLKLEFYRGEQSWPSADDWTPVGIVVVPGTHNRYGDGSCGIMSLVGMDYNHPESGIPVTGTSQTDNISMYWGHYSATVGNNIFKDATALTNNSNYIPYQANSASTVCTIQSGYIVWPYDGNYSMPTSDASIAYTNTDGYVTATSGKAGCDFNGIRNTVALYVKTSTRTQWTASTVTNATGKTYTPAAACCGRFKTIGTKSFLDVFSGTTSNNLKYGTSASTKDNKGFWYLPAEGELCYLPRYRFEINKTILKLNQKYGNVGIQLDMSGLYWSSSEHNNADAWYMHIANGALLWYDKNDNCLVRAFMRL